MGPAHNHGQKAMWKVVIEDTHGVYYLYHLPITSSSMQSSVMESLKNLAKTHGHPWKLFFLLKTQTVKKAEIASSVDTDIEENSLPIKVAIETHTPDQYLTTAYVAPNRLSPDPHFVSSHAQFAVEGGDKALLISLTLSKPMLTLFLSVLMTLGIGVGVLVGLLTKRADIGLLVGTAVVTAFGCVETAVFWLLK